MQEEEERKKKKIRASHWETNKVQTVEEVAHPHTHTHTWRHTECVTKSARRSERAARETEPTRGDSGVADAPKKKRQIDDDDDPNEFCARPRKRKAKNK